MGARRLGAAPSEEVVSLVTQAFWDAWDDRLGEFERRPPCSPRWRCGCGCGTIS